MNFDKQQRFGVVAVAALAIALGTQGDDGGTARALPQAAVCQAAVASDADEIHCTRLFALDPAASTLDMLTGEFGRVAVGGEYWSRSGHVAFTTNLVTGRDELVGGIRHGWAAALVDIGDLRDAQTLFTALPSLAVTDEGLVAGKPERFGRDPDAHLIVAAPAAPVVEGFVRAEVAVGHLYFLDTADGTQRVRALLRVLAHTPEQELVLQWRILH